MLGLENNFITKVVEGNYQLLIEKRGKRLKAEEVQEWEVTTDRDEVGEHRRVNPNLLRELSRAPRDLGPAFCLYRRERKGKREKKRK